MRSSVIVAVSLVAFTVAAPIFQRDTTQTTDVTTTTGSTSDDDALTRLMVAAQNYDPNDDASVAELQSAGNDLSPEQTAQLQTVAENVANALAILKGLSAQDRRDVEKYIIKHLTPTQVATLLMLLDKQSPQQAANAADPQNGAEPGKLPDGTVKRYFSIPEEQRPEVLSYVLAADLSQEQFEKIQKYANKVKAEEDDDDDDKKPQTKPAKKPETKPAPKPAPAPEAKTDTTGQSQTGHATTFPKEQPVPAPAAAAASNGSSDDTAAALTQDQADQIGAYLQCIDANTANQLIEEAKTAGASDDDLATLKGEIPSLNDPKWVAPQECAAAAAAAAKRSLADLD